MARGKPGLNGAPSSSGTVREGSKGDNNGGAFRGNSKKTAVSSGAIRSTGPSHAQNLRKARQAGAIAPDLSSTYKRS